MTRTSEIDDLFAEAIPKINAYLKWNNSDGTQHYDGETREIIVFIRNAMNDFVIGDWSVYGELDPEAEARRHELLLKVKTAWEEWNEPDCSRVMREETHQQ